jgi:hypothetical protein
MIDGIGKNLIDRSNPRIAEDPQRGGEPKAVKHVAARCRL